MRSLALFALGAAAVATVAPARADCDPETHLSTCFDADTFWPHAGPGYFNFVGGTETTPTNTVGFGFFSTYLARPIVLLVPSVAPEGAEVLAIDHLWDATLVFSLGLLDRLEANVALPVAVYRTGTGLSTLTSQGSQEVARGAMRDVRAGAAYRLLGGPPYGMAARLELSLPTGAESSFAGDRSVVVAPTLAGEARSGPFLAGVEIGGRLRKTSDLAGSRVGSQLSFALGAGADILRRGKLGIFVDAIALPALAAQHTLSFDPATGQRIVSDNRSALVPAEWEASLRSADVIADGISVSLGAGTSLSAGESAVTSPRYRVLLAVRYTPSLP